MGYFELILGCIYSGKTTELLRKINKYTFINKKIIIFVKEGNNQLKTHDDRYHTQNVYLVKTASEMTQLSKNCDIIFIDNLHLFERDVCEFIQHQVNDNDKIIIATGLNSTYNMETPQNICELVPETDKLTFLRAKMIFDNQIIDASFSRWDNDKQKYEVCNRKNIRGNGYLELILGPMFSGKTTELIRTAKCYQNIGLKVLAINHKINDRYETKEICSHDLLKWGNTISLEKLEDIKLYNEQYEKNKVIMIEETQFFTDAFECIKKMIEIDGKIVIACGLDGNYRKKPFGDMCKLICIADNVRKLHAVCLVTGNLTQAPFTRRIIDNDEEKIVGGKDSYIACSRFAFNLSNEKFKQAQNPKKSHVE